MSAYQKADDSCFLGQERSAGGGIHATRDYKTSEVYYEALKNLCRAIQNKGRGTLTFGVVLLHDKAHLHAAACTGALLEHFNWELFDHPPCSTDLASSDYRLFMYLKNWSGSLSLSRARTERVCVSLQYNLEI
jgi:hypothetical protein